MAITIEYGCDTLSLHGVEFSKLTLLGYIMNLYMIKISSKEFLIKNLKALAVELYHMQQFNPDRPTMISLLELTSVMQLFVGQPIRPIRNSS